MRDAAKLQKTTERSDKVCLRRDLVRLFFRRLGLKIMHAAVSPGMKHST